MTHPRKVSATTTWRLGQRVITARVHTTPSRVVANFIVLAKTAPLGRTPATLLRFAKRDRRPIATGSAQEIVRDAAPRGIAACVRVECSAARRFGLQREDIVEAMGQPRDRYVC